MMMMMEVRCRVTDGWVNGKQLMKERALLTLDMADLQRIAEKWDRIYNLMGKHPAGGIKVASHLIHCLIAWQKSPLAMTCFYLIGHGSSSWSPWFYGKKQKLYYAFRAFAEMAHYENLVRCASDSEAIRLIAGRDAQGKRAILLAVFLPEGESCGEIAVRLPSGMESVKWKVLLLDEAHDLEEIACGTGDNVLILPDSGGEYRIYLIREEE